MTLIQATMMGKTVILLIAVRLNLREQNVQNAWQRGKERHSQVRLTIRSKRVILSLVMGVSQQEQSSVLRCLSLQEIHFAYFDKRAYIYKMSHVHRSCICQFVVSSVISSYNINHGTSH